MYIENKEPRYCINIKEGKKSERVDTIKKKS